MAKQAPIEIRYSEQDDPRRVAALPYRRSTWREVLGKRPATVSRVDMSTGQRIATMSGTGEISERG